MHIIRVLALIFMYFSAISLEPCVMSNRECIEFKSNE